MAESTNNSAASMAASSAPMRIENISIPGFGGGASKEAFDPKNYRVRYSKIDMDDPGSVAELEILETKGLMGTEIVVLNKDKFTFMNQYFIIVCYLEYITSP